MKRHSRALIVCAAAISNWLKMKFLQPGEMHTTTLVFNLCICTHTCFEYTARTHTLMPIRHIYANRLRNLVGKCCDFVQSICARNQSIWFLCVVVVELNSFPLRLFPFSSIRMLFPQTIHLHNVYYSRCVYLTKQNLNIIRFFFIEFSLFI